VSGFSRTVAAATYFVAILPLRIGRPRVRSPRKMRTYTHDTVTRLIGRIYDAVLDPGSWSGFLSDLGEAMDGHGLSLNLIDPLSGNTIYCVTAKSDPTFVDQYRRYYSACDPWAQEGRRRNLLRPGLIALGETIVPRSALIRTEFYNDLGRDFDFCGGVGALFQFEQSLMGISLSQYKFGQFGRSELRLIRVLAPHVERAMKVYQSLEGAEMISAQANAALDRINCGVLFLSSSGGLLFANRAARALLSTRDGLLTVRGELHATTPAQTTKLRAAIGIALRVSEGATLAETPAIIIQRPSCRWPLSVLVTPLPRAAGTLGFGTPAVALFVTDPARSVPSEMESIRAMLGLTLGEARLVQLLASGRTVTEAADVLSLRLETVRKKLKLVFQKTDTHRQTDLVRLALLCMNLASWAH
jgi:DNA-binding CsgD family transcriptional regulator